MSLSVRLFQFHKGSIKTSLARQSRMSPPRFQFHKGSIKTRRVGGATTHR